MKTQMVEITGQTYNVKEVLKGFGGRFVPERKSWILPELNYSYLCGLAPTGRVRVAPEQLAKLSVRTADAEEYTGVLYSKSGETYVKSVNGRPTLTKSGISGEWEDVVS